MEVTLLVLRIVLIILLYAFLGLIVVLLWRDVRSAAAGQTAPATRERPARMIVVEGVEGVQTGETYALKPYTSIGRASTNTIEMPDTYCSAEHALVVWRGNQWWIEDRDSRNGTQLNDIPIEAPTIVSAGDVIRIGRVRLRFEVEDGK